MGFNIGVGDSKFVVVNDVHMKFAYSDKVLFADLRTSRKTGRPKTDKDTGAIINDKDGKPVPERVYTHWEGRFVGKAFEPAKTLNGQAINILNGWLDKEVREKDGRKYENVFVVITDFVVSDGDEREGDSFLKEVEQGIEDVSAAFRSLNGDENTPSMEN